MNRPFALLGPAVVRLASQNPDREEWDTVERMRGKVERFQRIPVKGKQLIHAVSYAPSRSARISRIALIVICDLMQGALQLERVITVD